MNVTQLFESLPWQVAVIAMLAFLVYKLVTYMATKMVSLEVWQQACDRTDRFEAALLVIRDAVLRLAGGAK